MEEKANKETSRMAGDSMKNRTLEFLQSSVEQFLALAQSASDAIITADSQGNVIFWNNAAKRIFGYSADEARGKPVTFIMPERFHAAHQQAMKRLALTGESRIMGQVVEGAGLRKNGSEFPVELSLSMWKAKEGVFFSAIIRDVTERKRAEEEREKLQLHLIQSEKMAGVGTLANGVAHEFNNLLQIMRGITELAYHTKKSEDIEEAFSIVLNTSDKAAKIVRDLLSFSSPDVSEKELCDITELIESALSLLEGQLKKQNIKVIRRYEKIPLIEVNRAEVQQVFFNMIVNARDAMIPKGGKLEIAVKQVSDNLEASFHDTGKGIKKEELSKVFEPFYTTKGPLGGDVIPGTGLGLFVSYGIIKKHGGTIEVKSQATKGTTFTIKLPIIRRAFKKKTRKLLKKKRSNKNTPVDILIVDDEEEICRMLMKLLSSEGHRVKYVLAGKEAVERVREEHLDIVILDLVMPGIPGFKVLEEINRISPKINVIVMTGRIMKKALLKEIKQKGASSWILKPFNIEEMKTAINVTI